MKKNVVVTGATSFIGVHLIQELQKEAVELYQTLGEYKYYDDKFKL